MDEKTQNEQEFIDLLRQVLPEDREAFIVDMRELVRQLTAGVKTTL